MIVGLGDWREEGGFSRIEATDRTEHQEDDLDPFERFQESNEVLEILSAKAPEPEARIVEDMAKLLEGEKNE